MRFRKFFREPLVHFLAVGIVLFGAFGMMNRYRPDPGSDRTIMVDRESLLNFLQYRSKAFKPEFFAAQLDAMSAQERRNLVNDYVQEEVLYREAKAMGLEQGDYVIRQRLIQKMRFLIEDLAGNRPKPDEALLEAYFQKNRERYRIEASVTFTHVFFDTSLHGDEKAQRLARSMKDELNARGAAFSDAPQYGDRFPFLQNYVERTFDYVASHFGNEFLTSLKSLEPSEKAWRGPIRSTYGYHLVLITHRTEARLPELDEIRSQVEEDLLRDQIEETRSQSMDRLTEQYKIELKDLE
jgi:hypothetical protein